MKKKSIVILLSTILVLMLIYSIYSIFSKNRVNENTNFNSIVEEGPKEHVGVDEPTTNPDLKIITQEETSTADKVSSTG